MGWWWDAAAADEKTGSALDESPRHDGELSQSQCEWEEVQMVYVRVMGACVRKRRGG